MEYKGVRQGATATSACRRLWKHFLSVLRLHLHPNGPQKLRSRILENSSTLSLGSNRSKTFKDWNEEEKKNWFTSDPISQWIHFLYMLLPHSASLMCTLWELKRASVQGRHLARGPFLPVTPSKIELHQGDAGGCINVRQEAWVHFFFFFFLWNIFTCIQPEDSKHMHPGQLTHRKRWTSMFWATVLMSQTGFWNCFRKLFFCTIHLIYQPMFIF